MMSLVSPIGLWLNMFSLEEARWHKWLIVETPVFSNTNLEKSAASRYMDQAFHIYTLTLAGQREDHQSGAVLTHLYR